jgi:hypothetical protein
MMNSREKTISGTITSTFIAKISVELHGIKTDRSMQTGGDASSVLREYMFKNRDGIATIAI